MDAQSMHDDARDVSGVCRIVIGGEGDDICSMCQQQMHRLHTMCSVLRRVGWRMLRMCDDGCMCAHMRVSTVR
jgi:hypothetical protein